MRDSFRNELWGVIMIKGMIKYPGKCPEVIQIDDTKSTPYSELIGGCLDYRRFPNYRGSMYVLCHDEGKLQDMARNLALPSYADYLVGTIVFIGYDGGEDFISLSDEQIEYIKEYCFKYSFTRFA